MHTWNSFTKNTLFLTHTHNTYIAHTRTNFSTTGSYTHPEHIGGAYQQIWRFFTGMCARACIYTDIWGKLRGGGVTLVLSCSDRFVTEKYMYACTSTCCYYVLFFFQDKKNYACICMEMIRAYVCPYVVIMFNFFFKQTHLFLCLCLSSSVSLSVCLSPVLFLFFNSLSVTLPPPFSLRFHSLSLAHTLSIAI